MELAGRRVDHLVADCGTEEALHGSVEVEESRIAFGEQTEGSRLRVSYIQEQTSGTIQTIVYPAHIQKDYIAT